MHERLFTLNGQARARFAGRAADLPPARAFAQVRTLRLADGPDGVHKDAPARAEPRRQREVRS
ncbi:hypothetical protein [Dactylosporangium sp. CA-233914]|uniref:hypothetical protein n=1 Tax=Dactylosporangium sp. CA-233914 TaxID=3239934 RepID=UPI003D906D05